MKGQDRALNQPTIDPWIYVLAIIIGLAMLFFFCASQVQAKLPEIPSFEAGAKDAATLPAGNRNTDNQSKLQVWYGDYSDISNERAGPAPESANAKKLSGRVQTEDGTTNLLGKIWGFFKSYFWMNQPESSQSDAPAFTSP